MKLDDVLSDACALLDEMGTCTEKCKDFNETRALLEKACRLDEKRAKPGEWIDIGGISLKKPSKDDYKLVIFGIAIFIPLAIVFTFIHELGHYIVASIFGWHVIEFHVSLFPFILEPLAGYVMFIVPPGAETWQIVATYGAGSLFTMMFSYAFFVLFYRFKLNRYVELLLVLYMVVFGLDAIVYIMGDLFFGGTGDWHNAYILDPIAVFFVALLCIVNIVLFVANIKKIARNIDI